jgi:hexosaminidase
MRTWGTFKYTMTPSEDTMRVLQKVFDQVADLFPDGMVHIGGDEVSKEEWQNSRRARALLQTEHLHNVQAYFNTRCAELLRGKNISVFAWDEAPAVGGFPEDGIVVAWRSANEVVKAARQGRRVINADQDALYFDHYQGPAASEPKAFGGFSPMEKVYAYDPVPAALTEEQQHHIIGGQAQLWSEYIPNWEHAEYMAFPRAYALAERLWSPKGQANSFSEFKKRLASRLQELDGMGVAYRKI